MMKEYDRHQQELLASNQVCRCKHLGAVHKDRAYGFAIGHGACTVEDCPCGRFTWAGWVDDNLVPKGGT